MPRHCYFQDQLAGPHSRLNGAFPALKAADSVSDVLGPGRLYGVKSTTFVVKWAADTSQGKIVIESNVDPNATGAWKNETTFNWAAGGTVDEYTITGARMALRARVDATAVDGAGATVDAIGVN